MPGPRLTRQFGILAELQRSAKTTESFDIYRLFMDDDGTFPNNRQYPILLYKGSYFGSQSEASQIITGSGQWTSPWVWGIFTFHHYHSNAWELLMCTRGEASIQLGGPTGPKVEVARGDMMLIPPGFAHKQLKETGGFTLLGSYPIVDEDKLGPVDTLRQAPSDGQRENIASCPLPPKDPFFSLAVEELAEFPSTIDQSD